MRFMLCLAVCSSLCLASCSVARGPIGFWSHNHLDRQDERHGPWRVYYDAANQQIANKGRFRHGRVVGRWRYYTPGAGLEHIERFYRHRPDFVTLVYYHPNGQVARRGRARYVDEPDGPHFYWFGDWQLFALDGRPIKVETYEVGRLVKTRLLR